MESVSWLSFSLYLGSACSSSIFGPLVDVCEFYAGMNCRARCSLPSYAITVLQIAERFSSVRMCFERNGVPDRVGHVLIFDVIADIDINDSAADVVSVPTTCPIPMKYG